MEQDPSDPIKGGCGDVPVEQKPASQTNKILPPIDA